MPVMISVIAPILLSVQDVNNHIPRNPRNQNLTKQERESIKRLSTDTSITIKKADKGNAIVIMDTSDYIKEAERQLSDSNFYIEKDIDMSDIHREKIVDILYTMWSKDEIDNKTFNFLKPTEESTRTSKFYFLPKIHKKEVKGRPIISGNGCPTENISAFVDEYIKGYV